MMNMVGHNFQLSSAKQIWLFEDLKIPKNKIELKYVKVQWKT